MAVDPDFKTTPASEVSKGLAQQNLVNSLYAHVDREEGDNTESPVIRAVKSSLKEMVFGMKKPDAKNGNNAQADLQAKAGELAKNKLF